MKFVNLDDVKGEIKEQYLRDMVDEDYSLLDIFEKRAISIVRSKIDHIVNINYELEQIGDNRNDNFLRVLLILMSYEAESLLTVGDVPDNTKERKNDVMAYLNSVMNKDGDIPHGWMLKDPTVDKTTIQSKFSVPKPLQSKIVF